jgi:hypothetical protein
MSRRILGFVLGTLLLASVQVFAASVEVSLPVPPNADPLPVYPHAAPRNDAVVDESRMKTVSVDGPLRGSLTAQTYISRDSADKILGFYRSALKNYGDLVECSGGKNPEVNVRINVQSLGEMTCNPDDIGSGGTELRVGDGREQRIVTVRAISGGSEFTLVSVVRRPRKPNFF